jgi:glycosyltransferase involved in cell wall biosynthesis
VKTIPRSNVVVLFVDSLAAAGAQRQIVLLAKELQYRGYDPRVLIYHEILDLKPELDSARIPVTLIPRSGFGFLAFCRKIYAFLRSVRPIAIIAFLHGPSAIARVIAPFARVPVVVTSERSVALYGSRTIYWMERLTSRLSSMVVANSITGRDLILQQGRISADRVAVIYNGLDTTVFAPPENCTRQDARRQLQISDDCFVIVLPGRLVWEKNHECLLRAAAQSRLARPFLILIVGKEIDLELKAKLQKLIDELGISAETRFIGPASDIVRVYALCDVMVLPSLSEAMPNVVMEAMSCGRIVIASAVSDNDRIIEHGVSGFVFPNNDVGALARLLAHCQSLSEIERHAIGNAARRRAKELFSKERMAGAYVELIDGAATRLG